MNNKAKVILILAKMRANGIDVVEDSAVDSWDELDIEYFLANYEEAYL